MSGTFTDKRRILSEVDAVSTSELCGLIGVNVSAKSIEELGEVRPVFVSATGTYWRRDHVPLIAIALSARLLRLAGSLQHVINIERESYGRQVETNRSDVSA